MGNRLFPSLFRILPVIFTARIFQLRIRLGRIEFHLITLLAAELPSAVSLFSSS